MPVNAPENFDEMLNHWVQSNQPNVGWCMLCDSAIISAGELIPGTSTHNCEAGRALEREIRASEEQNNVE